MFACGLSLYGNIGVSEAGTVESTVPSFELDELVVTASKYAVDYTKNASTIERKDIEIMHIQNVEEALRTVPGVQFLNYAMPGYNMNAVRINGSDLVVVLVDGVRMSEGRYYPFHMLTAENIEKIEVLRGAAATRYGSGAKGGVINIVTRKAKQNATKIDVAKGSYHTDIHSLYGEGAQKYLNYSFYYKKFKQGTTEDADGVQWVGGQEDENSGLKLDYKLSNMANFSFQYNNNKNDFNIMDHIYKQDITGNYHTQETLFRYDQKIGKSAKNTMSYRTGRVYHVGLMRNFWEADIERRPFWGSNYRNRVFINTLEKKFGDQHTVAVGYENSTHNMLSQGKKLQPDGSYLYYDREAENTAYFLEEEWRFDNRWKFTAGVRYDNPSGGFAHIKSNTAKSFNLSHAFNKDTNIYVAHNDFFVLPSIDQIFNPQTGAGDLVAETGYNREIGINHIFDKDTVMSVHYFHRFTENNIGYEHSSGTWKNGNDKAHGFDFELNRKFSEQWSTKLGYSYLNYIYKKGTTQFGYLPKHLMTVGADYTAGKWEVGLDGRGFLGRGGDQVKAEGWPSSHYWVFNLGINYKPTKNMKAYLKVNNITNTLYAEHTNVIWADMGPGQGGQVGSADWYGMPGRNFLAGMEFNF